MTKSLRPDEIAKMPKDGIDFRDFILQVASNNNWVYDWSEYSTAIVNAKKGVLGRISTTLKELEDDRFLIKQSGNRVYNVTTKGIEYHKTGKATKDPNNLMQINANNVVFANGDINAPLSQSNDHSSSGIKVETKSPIKHPPKMLMQTLLENKTIVTIISTVIGGLILYVVTKILEHYNLIKL